MKNYEIKNTESGVNTVKDIDTVSRRVKVAISRMGNLDLDNDVIEKSAYSRTIAARGPKGVNLIWHLTDHNASLKSAIAKFSDLYVEGDYLMGVTNIPNTSWGNDMMEFYKTGNINQHSVGFRIVQSETVNKGKENEYRLIKEIFLYEGSAVLWGANPDTDTVSVGKSVTPEEAQKDFFDTLKEINNLATSLRKGNFTDETCELIEISLAQKTTKIEQLYRISTQPVVKAPDPAESKRLLDVFDAFNNSLKLQNDGRKRTSAET